MSDVENKSAVTVLAEVVVMIERREAEARQEYNKIGRRLRGRTLAYVASMSDNEFTAEQIAHDCARVRWYESRDALTAARELTRDL